MRAAYLAPALLAALVGCATHIPDGAFVCSTDDDCPPLQHCVAALCRAGDAGANVDAGFDAAMTSDANVLDVGTDAGTDGGSDGGSDVGLDVGPDADLFEVTGTIYYHEASSTPTAPQAFDALALSLQTLVPGTTDLSTPIFPTVSTTDSRGFAGVPHGTIQYLSAGTSNYYVTSERSYVIDTHVQGRPSPIQSADATTQITFGMSAMTAWQSGDVIELIATNENLYFYLTEGDVTPPAVGSHNLTGYQVTWLDNPLVQGSMGDTLRMFHTSVATFGTTQANIVADEFTFPVFDQLDGSSLSRSGAFSVVLPTTTADIDWRLPDFEAMASRVGPAVVGAGQHQLDIQAQPSRPASIGQFAGTLDLFAITDPATTTDVNLGTVHFGNPYLPTDLLRHVEVAFNVTYQVPTAMPHMFGTDTPRVGRWDEQTATLSGTIEPMVGPPVNLAVNGSTLDGSTAITEVSLTNPTTISWSPSADLSPPTAYRLTFYELYANADNTARAARTTFIVRTGTSIVLPPGVLAAGSYYYILATAEIYDVDSGHVPYAYAGYASSMLHAN